MQLLQFQIHLLCIQLFANQVQENKNQSVSPRKHYLTCLLNAEWFSNNETCCFAQLHAIIQIQQSFNSVYFLANFTLP